jgi:transcriptional regulator with XRE-family HTH domain
MLSVTKETTPDPTPAALALAKSLADLMTERSWSQEALAERSGVSQGTISRLKRATIAKPKLADVEALAAAFGVPISRLTRTSSSAPTPRATSSGALEIALFRAMHPDRYQPAVFDAARDAAREAGELHARDVDKLAKAMLDAAAALSADGRPMTPVAILARVLSEGV